MKFLFLIYGFATAKFSCDPMTPETVGTAIEDPVILLNNEICIGYEGGTVDCSAVLAQTQSGGDSTCEISGNNYHNWPIDGDAYDCHGWQSTANSKEHLNSANNICCDGTTLYYTQYADTLDCVHEDGKPEPQLKTFTLNECHQGIPPTLYDIGVNFDCCDPSTVCTPGILPDDPSTGGDTTAPDDPSAGGGGDTTAPDESSSLWYLWLLGIGAVLAAAFYIKTRVCKDHTRTATYNSVMQDNVINEYQPPPTSA